MSEQKVYELDDAGNFTGRIISVPQDQIYKLINDPQKEKIKEIKIIMDKYGIDIDDLRDNDDYDQED